MLTCFSHVQSFATPGTVARQAPLSMGFSRQEYCNGLPCPPPGDLPNPGIKAMSPLLLHWQAVLYHKRHLGSPLTPLLLINKGELAWCFIVAMSSTCQISSVVFSMDSYFISSALVLYLPLIFNEIKDTLTWVSTGKEHQDNHPRWYMNILDSDKKENWILLKS